MINIIISFLTFLEVSSAILLIAIILMQRSKSGGGLGAIAGGATEEVFGSNAGNILTKTTIILSIFFFLNTLGLAVLQGNTLKDRNTSVVDELITEVDAAVETEQDKNSEEKNLTGTNEVEDIPSAEPADK